MPKSPRVSAPRGRKPLVVAAVAPELESVTPAQRGVLSLLVQGHELSEIAELLEISVATVRNHMQAVYETFGVRSQPKLLALFLQRVVARQASASRRRKGT
jgi:DNA-binding NarL/FixJ family response regulator